jgi:predicted nucleic acid-binding protein
MSLVVVLDAGPLGMVTNPKSSPENEACQAWLSRLVGRGISVVIPEITDYEVRRELLRADKVKGIARLDALKSMLPFAPITSAAMQRAAEYWASARKAGRKAADDAALDGDVILAAQADLLRAAGDEVMIATTNMRHLEMFIPARLWREIVPA